MLQTKVITKELCAVAFHAAEILIRPRGKDHFGKETTIAHIDAEGNLVICEEVARKYGISIKMQ